MKPLSLEAKKAYCAKTRHSNYLASLRLEGFDTSRQDANRKLPTQESAIKIHKQGKA
jgi:hypothetical protein